MFPSKAAAEGRKSDDESSNMLNFFFPASIFRLALSGYLEVEKRLTPTHFNI
jgi:hypothetical protein